MFRFGSVKLANVVDLQALLFGISGIVKHIGGDALKIYDFEGEKNISGDYIHQARTTMRLSQAALAARMQVNGVNIEREAISKIETKDRFVTDYELMIFAKVLGVPMEWLTGQNQKDN